MLTTVFELLPASGYIILFFAFTEFFLLTSFSETLKGKEVAWITMINVAAFASLALILLLGQLIFTLGIDRSELIHSEASFTGILVGAEIVFWVLFGFPWIDDEEASHGDPPPMRWE